MKRVTAMLLIAGLLLSNAGYVQASENVATPLIEFEEKTVEEVPVNAIPLETLEWENFYAPDNAAGGLELTIGNALSLKREVTYQIKVTSADQKTEKTETVSLKAEECSKTVFIDQLKSGNYTVEITAPGFAAYTQNVEINGTVESAQIYNGVLLLDSVEYKSGSVHPGVLLLGDADGDSSITEKDKEVLLDAASGRKTAALADLDGDGSVDIVDLQYFTNSWKQGKKKIDTQAVWVSRVAENAVEVKNGSKTEVTGNLEQLLSDEGSVSLKPAGEQEISKEHPVEIGIALQSRTQEAENEYVWMEQIEITTGNQGIEDGEIILETAEGEQSFQMKDGKPVTKGARAVVQNKEPQSAQVNKFTIDLEGKTAVKRVIIRVTKASGNNQLVEISKVEFLNDTENRIPEPKMDIPKKLSAKAGNQSVTLTWEASANVTGYEAEITCDGKTEVIRAAANTLKVTSFQKKELVNGKTYSVRVQAVNGSWSSGYCEKISAVPNAQSRPDAPDYVTLTGGYQKILVSWKKAEDADHYFVYHRVKGSQKYTKSSEITQTSYEITGLKDQATYEVYVTAANKLGESKPSLVSEAATTVLKAVILPKYQLINESNGTGVLTSHIVSATHDRGEMKDSTLDAGSKTSALGVVDDSFASYYQVLDWDDGGVYPAESKGIYVTFDQQYEMNYITFAEVEDIGSYNGASVYYREAGKTKEQKAEVSGVVQKKDANGRNYYAIKLADPIRTDKIRIGFTRYGNFRNIVIAELKFYHYDSLEDDVMALYADDLHTKLKDTVDEETIKALQTRLDTKDKKSGEYPPEKESIQKELDNAKGLLTTALGESLEVSPLITAAKDGHLGFGGLNAWQPLGVSAQSGDTVVIYVGHDSLKTGADAALRLIATQYHAESGNVSAEIAKLKVGRNEVTIPKLQTLAAECGGALYVQYTGNNINDRYAVRVSGGTEIPVLNLYGVDGKAERLEKTEAYVKTLKEHVEALESVHAANHEKNSYEKENCIAGATDIMLDQMMYSVSAEQILSGLGSGTIQEQAEKLLKSLDAMEQMMELFYQHKGLTDDANASENDRMPSQHLNIRYMRMFAGAFMYAAGNHIGIEWGSVPGLATAVPIESTNGKYVSGNLFGWGIAHEIGHNINQRSYEVAEITNNYFAQLTTARDTNESVRFEYDQVYDKVTSGTVGRSENQATQLAMYWQLHLAYDKGYNFKTYDSYEEQFEKLFYARVDTYARDTSRAPGERSLTLDGDSDQNFMRLASAAAEKDLTEFFTRWGMTPTEETLAYMQQFEKEERAIYYGNDDARVYEIEHPKAANIKEQDVISKDSTVTLNEAVANEVTLTISSSADPAVLSGYEIIRCTYEGGIASKQVVGFAPILGESATVTWNDHVSSINNRAVTYEAAAVDRFGYYSAAKEIGTVHVSHDGSLEKSLWNVLTNMTSSQDQTVDATEEMPCDPITEPAVLKILDDDYQKETYVGKAQNDAYVILEMKRSYEICALKYTLADQKDGITDFQIEISEDGKTWTTVREDAFEAKSGSQTVYFQNEKNDPWVATYDAAYVRLTAKNTAGKNVAITELDILGPTGDSIFFGMSAEDPSGAVGILADAYEYEEEKTIPKGSLVFTGIYKGNPAYNVVLLYDENGNIVGGEEADGTIKAQQIILADVPEHGLLGEVSDGRWIYWLEPDAEGNVPKVSGKVRAELYRVDHALTNEGQRLVSDTLPMEMPKTLGYIEFTNK